MARRTKATLGRAAMKWLTTTVNSTRAATVGRLQDQWQRLMSYRAAYQKMFGPGPVETRGLLRVSPGQSGPTKGEG